MLQSDEVKSILVVSNASNENFASKLITGCQNNSCIKSYGHKSSFQLDFFFC